MERRGLLLAGGTGSRLAPLTLAVNKHLLPVYDKPLIYYPLTTLMLCGIRELGLVTTPRALPLFQLLLGDGRQWGISLSYFVQETPLGLAHALLQAQQFLNGHASAVILGDNVFYGSGLVQLLRHTCAQPDGARVFAYHVKNPQDYGVAELDADGKVLSLHEKPTQPRSNLAVTGLYFYDETACERAAQLPPSARGELEITDLNRSYLADGALKLELMGRGFTWLDTGTPEAMLQASQLIQALELRQGLMVASPEEIAWRQGWISAAQLHTAGVRLAQTAYGQHLLALLGEVEREIP
ncbi:MAG: glucose-1-phosphate thymidylyltransferase RfbA [Myxococcota bacterium]